MDKQKNYFSIKKKMRKCVYSEHGNTDFSKLTVIDEMIQRKVCKRHRSKRKVFLHMWTNSSKATSPSSSLQWRKGGTRYRAGSLNPESQAYQTAIHHFRKKHRKTTRRLCRKMGKRRGLPQVHASKQPHVRNH